LTKPLLKVYLLVEGQVLNVSNEHLEFIKMSVSFYDKGDNFITSESSTYIDKWKGLGPNERSTYIVDTELDPRIAKFTIEFSDKEHGVLKTSEQQKL